MRPCSSRSENLSGFAPPGNSTVSSFHATPTMLATPGQTDKGPAPSSVPRPPVPSFNSGSTAMVRCLFASPTHLSRGPSPLFSTRRLLTDVVRVQTMALDFSKLQEAMDDPERCLSVSARARLLESPWGAKQQVEDANPSSVKKLAEKWSAAGIGIAPPRPVAQKTLQFTPGKGRDAEERVALGVLNKSPAAPQVQMQETRIRKEDKENAGALDHVAPICPDSIEIALDTGCCDEDGVCRDEATVANAVLNMAVDAVLASTGSVEATKKPSDDEIEYECAGVVSDIVAAVESVGCCSDEALTEPSLTAHAEEADEMADSSQEQAVMSTGTEDLASSLTHSLQTSLEHNDVTSEGRCVEETGLAQETPPTVEHIGDYEHSDADEEARGAMHTDDANALPANLSGKGPAAEFATEKAEPEQPADDELQTEHAESPFRQRMRRSFGASPQHQQSLEDGVPQDPEASIAQSAAEQDHGRNLEVVASPVSAGSSILEPCNASTARRVSGEGPPKKRQSSPMEEHLQHVVKSTVVSFCRDVEEENCTLKSRVKRLEEQLIATNQQLAKTSAQLAQCATKEQIAELQTLLRGTDLGVSSSSRRPRSASCTSCTIS